MTVRSGSTVPRTQYIGHACTRFLAHTAARAVTLRFLARDEMTTPFDYAPDGGSADSIDGVLAVVSSRTATNSSRPDRLAHIRITFLGQFCRRALERRGWREREGRAMEKSRVGRIWF